MQAALICTCFLHYPTEALTQAGKNLHMHMYILTHRPFMLGEKKFKLNALQTRKEYSHSMTCSLWSPPSPPRCVLCQHGSPAGPSISTAHSWPRTGTPIRCEFSVMGDSHWCKMLSTWGFVTLSYLCELKVFYGIKFFKCKFQKNCHN